MILFLVFAAMADTGAPEEPVPVDAEYACYYTWLVASAIAWAMGCTGDPALSMRGAPYCRVEDSDPTYCDSGLSCCDSEDCWFELHERRYDCTTRWDCEGAINAYLADACGENT